MKQKIYTIKEQNGVQVLKADGIVQSCPFQQATPVQDKLRGIQLIPAACTSQCPHFHIKKWDTDNDPFFTAELTCGPLPMEARVVTSEQDEPKQETKSGIILN